MQGANKGAMKTNDSVEFLERGFIVIILNNRIKLTSLIKVLFLNSGLTFAAGIIQTEEWRVIGSGLLSL